MENAALKNLQDRLMALCRSAEDLANATQDFPALTCNLARVNASLKMVAMDLGMTTVDSRGDR